LQVGCPSEAPPKDLPRLCAIALTLAAGYQFCKLTTWGSFLFFWIALGYYYKAF
jgi:hypothetical protein